MPFTYIEGDSLLHKLDARCKFFTICLISISMLYAHFLMCLLYSAVLFVFFKTLKIDILKILHSIKYFLLLLLFVVAARSFSTNGDTLFSVFNITVTKQGLGDGCFIAFKFFLIMLSSVIVSLTTKPSFVKSAVQWFLRPIPFIPEKRVSVMVSLALKFMPLLVKQANAISDARRARCGDLIKNPIKKIIGLVFPLLQKGFLSADNLVFAMEARCYDDNRTDPEFQPSGKEPVFLVCTIVLSAGFFWF